MGSSSGRRRVRLTEAPLCLRRARRQAQAAFGGRFAKLDPCARLRPFSTIGLDAANRPVGPDLCVEAYGETKPRRIGAVTPKGPKRREGARPRARLTAMRRRGPPPPRAPQTEAFTSLLVGGKKRGERPAPYHYKPLK
jgi:hypothetical protein